MRGLVLPILVPLCTAAVLMLAPKRAAPPRWISLIGSVVQLGLSHPCTAFDKWRVLPVVESADSDLVVDLVRTWF